MQADVIRRNSPPRRPRGLDDLPGAALRAIALLGLRTRVGLAMFAVGVLAFLFVDVMSHGFTIVEDAVDAYKDGDGSFGHAVWLALMLGAGFAAGSAGLAAIESRLRPPPPPPIGGGATSSRSRTPGRSRRKPRRTPARAPCGPA